LAPFEELESGSYYDKCKVKAEKLNPNWEIEAVRLYDYSENAVKEFV